MYNSQLGRASQTTTFMFDTPFRRPRRISTLTINSTRSTASTVRHGPKPNPVENTSLEAHGGKAAAKPDGAPSERSLGGPSAPSARSNPTPFSKSSSSSFTNSTGMLVRRFTQRRMKEKANPLDVEFPSLTSNNSTHPLITLRSPTNLSSGAISRSSSESTVTAVSVGSGRTLKRVTDAVSNLAGEPFVWRRMTTIRRRFKDSKSREKLFANEKELPRILGDLLKFLKPSHSTVFSADGYPQRVVQTANELMLQSLRWDFLPFNSGSLSIRAVAALVEYYSEVYWTCNSNEYAIPILYYMLRLVRLNLDELGSKEDLRASLGPVIERRVVPVFCDILAANPECKMEAQPILTMSAMFSLWGSAVDQVLQADEEQPFLERWIQATSARYISLVRVERSLIARRLLDNTVSVANNELTFAFCLLFAPLAARRPVFESTLTQLINDTDFVTVIELNHSSFGLLYTAFWFYVKWGPSCTVIDGLISQIMLTLIRNSTTSSFPWVEGNTFSNAIQTVRTLSYYQKIRAQVVAQDGPMGLLSSAVVAEREQVQCRKTSSDPSATLLNIMNTTLCYDNSFSQWETLARCWLLRGCSISDLSNSKAFSKKEFCVGVCLLLSAARSMPLCRTYLEEYDALRKLVSLVIASIQTSEVNEWVAYTIQKALSYAWTVPKFLELELPLVLMRRIYTKMKSEKKASRTRSTKIQVVKSSGTPPTNGGLETTCAWELDVLHSLWETGPVAQDAIKRAGWTVLSDEKELNQQVYKIMQDGRSS